MRRSHLPTLRVALAVGCVLLPGATVAQDGVGSSYPGAGGPFGAVESGALGYELALSGANVAERGSALVYSGIAYEVSGAVTLRATPGLEVEAHLESRTADGTSWRTLESASVRTAEAGHFEMSVRMPEEDLASPRVVFFVHRVGAPGRRFAYDVSALAARGIDVLTDRERYEPGETVHVWARLSSLRTGSPSADRALVVTLVDSDGAEIARQALTTRASGTGAVDVVLPETATVGTYTVRVESDASVLPATRVIEVFARTTERLVATITLDEDLVQPGGALRGVVRVTDPSGSPVRGAAVELYTSSDTSSRELFTTAADGTARFDGAAPSYLGTDVAYESVIARVVHGASGAITARTGYTIARTAWLVSATPEAGGLVPEVGTRVYLAVHDPRHTPITAGVELEVRGLGIPSGRAVVSTDAHGSAELVVSLPRGAAAQMSGGPCGGLTSTSLEIEVRSTPPVVASVCVPVALHAEVLPRARATVLAPGDVLEVDLLRRAPVVDRPVLLELLAHGERVVATAWVTGSRGTLTIPEDVRGVLDVRARAQAHDGHRAPLGDEGATLAGTGARTAVLVRPNDAFALSVSSGSAVAHVREHASVELRTSSLPAGAAWATLVVRDEAQQGGEGDYALESVAAELRAAVLGVVLPSDERFVRMALAAGIAMEPEAAGAAPLVPEPWETAIGRYAWRAATPGVLRDPIALREASVRTECATAMNALERLVVSLSSLERETRARAVRASGPRRDFGPDALALAGVPGLLTLGGVPLTPAHLHEIDASFSFDSVARRVARNRLVFILLGLASLGSAGDEAALRATAGQSPDRWLSLLVRLGMLSASQLVDPWGHAYELRRVTGRSPVVVFSDAAADWELSSPGPDGAPGNADDVRDPFARAVPEGTPYAVLSGEDDLMRMVSRIAPATDVLAAMAAAYSELGLGAEEELRGELVTATTTEMLAGEMLVTRGARIISLDELRIEGRMEEESAGDSWDDERDRDSGDPLAGLDGVGSEPADRSADWYSANADAPSGHARAYEFGDDLITGELARPDGSAARSPAPPPVFAALAAVIREDFPATLFFAGEVPLDAAGSAHVEVALADAITTYRLEAIVWTRSGWTTSGRGSLRVEQEAEVDAPVPGVAVVGDVMRLPLRIRNRGSAPLRVRLTVRTEGEAGVATGDAPTLDVPARDAAVATIEVRAMRAGLGAVVIEAVRDSDGAGLDSVRRAIEIVEDARVVHASVERLVTSGDEVTLDVPADATARGGGEVRLRVAAEVFGDPSDWWADDPPSAGFALALAGQVLPAALEESLTNWVRLDESSGDERTYAGRDPVTMASALGALWPSARMTDDEAGAAIRFLSSLATGPEATASGYDRYAPVSIAEPSSVLLALAPALRSPSRRSLAEDLRALAVLLADRAGSEGAVAAEDPETWARVAAALSLGSTAPADGARSDEMLRRLQRHVVATGDLAWLEPTHDDGSFEPRVAPTALLSLARSARGDPAAALPLLRGMADVGRGAARWAPRSRALAGAAAALLVRDGAEGAPASLTADGVAISLRQDAFARVAVVPGLSSAGAHIVRVALAEGAIALLDAEVRYAVPWTSPPRHAASVEIHWSGEVGPRDARSGLSLHIHNRGARVLVEPVVLIQLPAGAELDEATREGLASITGRAASVEGNVLRLELRPMAPGASIRIPLRARWSLGGSFRALGVTVTDEAARTRPAAVLASSAVDIADEGSEPSAEAAELPDAPAPVPAPALRPLGEVIR